MARPRKNVTALQGNYSKEMIQDRLEQEKSITGDSDNVVIPLFIKHDEIAVEEFLRIVEELKKVNLVTNVDSTMLGIYADCYSKYVESTMAMANQPLVVEYTNKGGETNSVPNPYIKIQNQDSQMLMKISEKYGLDPSSRSKIAHLQPSDKEEKVDPLMELMKGLKT